MASAEWELVLADLVAHRGDALTRYGYLLTGDVEDARDLVQESLVKVFGRLRNGYSVERAEAYLRRTMLNTHVDRARADGRWRRDAHLHVAPEQVDAADGDVGLRLDVLKELERLSPRERACIVLRYYEDRTVPEIARWLGLAPGSVKRYLSDALGKLHTALGPIADAGRKEGRDGHVA